ncbi:MAG: hypothetical protein NTZ80_02265 [Patescibacteria group bacterium]|nr:hypothetical protein [Patescibacteria group bacterium]
MRLNYLIPAGYILALILAITGCANTKTKDCETIDRVNLNLPSYFLYADKNIDIPENLLVFGPAISPNIFENEIIYKTNGWNFYCKSNSKPAQKIEYFYYSKACIMGAWRYRYAYICDDKYYILDGRDAGGVRLYGPFDIASQ